MNKSSSLRELNKRNSNQLQSSKSKFQWRVWLGLIGLLLVTIMDWQWAWGILFLIWVIPDIFRGTTYFIEPVERENNPLLYWTIIILWIGMSFLSLSTLFLAPTNYY